MSEFMHYSNPNAETMAINLQSFEAQGWEVMSFSTTVLSGSVVHHSWMRRPDDFEIPVLPVSNGLTENRLREVVAAAIGAQTGRVLSPETESHVQARAIAAIYAAGWKMADIRVLIITSDEGRGLDPVRYIEVDASATDAEGRTVMVGKVRAS